MSDEPDRCDLLGHLYAPDLLHCKRCRDCRGAVRIGNVLARCAIEHEDCGDDDER